MQRHERNLRVHKDSHSVKKPNEDKELNDTDTSIAEESNSLDVSHTGEFICWICQEELSSASLLGEHYDDHMK